MDDYQIAEILMLLQRIAEALEKIENSHENIAKRHSLYRL